MRGREEPRDGDTEGQSTALDHLRKHHSDSEQILYPTLLIRQRNLHSCYLLSLSYANRQT